MPLPPNKAHASYYLRVSVTDRCNLRCAYCRPREPEGEPPSASYASSAQLVDLVRHIDRRYRLGKLRLTGGEPLLRNDLVPLVQGFREVLPHAWLALTTNGVLLPRLAAPLRAAGLDALNISLDTLDPAAFAALTRGGRLETTLAGITAAHNAGFPKLKLNTVLIRRINGERLGELVRWAAQHACEIRFIELMPCGPGAELFATDFFAADDAIIHLKNEFEYLGGLAREGTARRHRFVVEGRSVVIGMITPVSHPFCEGCNRLRLDARGRLIPCLRGQTYVDLLQPLECGDGAALATRIEACLAAKGIPGEAWPDQQMVRIGG